MRNFFEIFLSNFTINFTYRNPRKKIHKSIYFYYFCFGIFCGQELMESRGGFVEFFRDFPRGFHRQFYSRISEKMFYVEDSWTLRAQEGLCNFSSIFSDLCGQVNLRIHKNVSKKYFLLKFWVFVGSLEDPWNF